METKELSLNELTSLWQESWNEKLPSSRLPAGQTRLGFYPIDRFNVAFDEGKPVSFRGWSETNGYTMLGMDYTKEEYRRQGLHKKLAPPMRGKIILGLSQKDESFSPEAWANTFERQGFVVNPTDEEIVRVFGETSPTTDAFKDFYSGGAKSFAIKNMDSTVTKNERYVRVMGKNGFNIMDTKYNKPVNRTGLSRSRAKAMLEAIKRGETDLTQYEGEVKRKARHSKWKTVLRKWKPDESFDKNASKDGKILMGKYGPYKQSDSLSAYINTHYTQKGHIRFKKTDFYERTDLMAEWIKRLRERESELEPINWIYCLEDEDEISYVEVHYRKNGSFSLERLKVDNEMGENPIIFNSARGPKQGYPSYAKFIDIWETGIKDSHKQSDSRDIFSQITDYSRKEEEARRKGIKKTKLELWKPYSDEFDDIAEKRDKFAEKLKNIKESNMTPETKSKKTLKIDTRIKQLISELRSLYYDFMRDLKENGHKVRFK